MANHRTVHPRKSEPHIFTVKTVFCPGITNIFDRIPDQLGNIDIAFRRDFAETNTKPVVTMVSAATRQRDPGPEWNQEWHLKSDPPFYQDVLPLLIQM
jgi:hypothetical protein